MAAFVFQVVESNEFVSFLSSGDAPAWTLVSDVVSDIPSGSIDGIPSGYVKIAIENGHRNSEFSH